MHRLAIAVVSMSAAAFAGPLDPPAGPVEPTNKTLAEVEPRIAVNAENTPGNASYTLIIDEPGSYYLTGNVECETGKSGIRIAADGVTLDLNGFTIMGGDGCVSGIALNSNGVTIRNGMIFDFDNDGIDMVSTHVRATVEDVFVRDCGGDGIDLDGVGVSVARCAVQGADGSGIIVGSTSSVTDCTVINAGFHGISTGENCTVSNNRVLQPAITGINAGNSSIVSDNVVRAGQNGIDAGSLASVTGNLVRFTTVSGISVAANSFVRDNTALQCAIGFRISSGNNLVDSNFAFGGETGFFSQFSTNTIIRNTARNNSMDDYDIGPAQQGPIISGGGVITSDNPWANFGS